MMGLLLLSDIGCPLKLVEKLAPGITSMGRGGDGSETPLVLAAPVAPPVFDALVLPAAPAIALLPALVAPSLDGCVPPLLPVELVPPLEVVLLRVPLAPPLAPSVMPAGAPPVPESAALEERCGAPSSLAHAAHVNKAIAAAERRERTCCANLGARWRPFSHEKPLRSEVHPDIIG
jgi:hypothetical protein